jgi:hypothetical protein
MSLATNMPCGVHGDPVVDFSQETKFVRWKHNSNNRDKHSKDQNRPMVRMAKLQRASLLVFPATQPKSRHSALSRIGNLVNLQSIIMLDC